LRIPISGLWRRAYCTNASANIEGVGQCNGRLDYPQLAHLFKPEGLAEAIDGVRRCAHLVAEEIVAIGQNNRYASAHRSLARTQGAFAHNEPGVWPTRTPATSVMALSVPGGNRPTASPTSRALGRTMTTPNPLR
jgi:hypothetical protein